jgi:protein-tyrosine phosphatase
MLRIRRRLYPWIERSVLAMRLLRVDGAAEWSKYRRLVFVCSGNICRSPYAEIAARDCGLAALSCGTHTENGRPADAVAITEAARRGKDLGRHKTRRWEDVELTPGDVIVVMQLKHALAVLPRARREGFSIVLLSSLLPDFKVLWDPYGRPADDYTYVFDLIDAGVKGIVDRLGAPKFTGKSDAYQPRNR